LVGRSQGMRKKVGGGEGSKEVTPGSEKGKVGEKSKQQKKAVGVLMGRGGKGKKIKKKKGGEPD